ncbi:hypothetical protein PMAYCL1PPCAC_23063, partial [Pristionchus mayeri]
LSSCSSCSECFGRDGTARSSLRDEHRRAIRVLLRLLARLVLVVRVLLHVHDAQSLCLCHEGCLLVLGQLAPSLTQPFADFSIVHVRLVLADLAALELRPHHEGVHRSLDVGGRLLAVRRVAVRRRGECGDLERSEGHVSGHSNRGPGASQWVDRQLGWLLLLQILGVGVLQLLLLQ